MIKNYIKNQKYMKSILFSLAIASVFMACNSKSSDSNKNIVGLDTSGYYKNNVMADTPRKALTAAPGTVTKQVVETRNPDGSVVTTSTTVMGAKTAAPVTHHSSVSSNSVAHSTTYPAVAATPARKGWSNRAKGAAIGGVGGAVVGAVVSKKKGKGAIIGGVLGAAGGYIIGTEKDKKTGR